MGKGSAEADPDLLVLDASVTINFLHLRAWREIVALSHFRVGIPRIVVDEIVNDRTGRREVQASIENGSIVAIDEPIPPLLLATFAEVQQRLGDRDATVLISAMMLGGAVAADDKQLRGEAARRGVRLVVGTENLMAMVVGQS